MTKQPQLKPSSSPFLFGSITQYRAYVGGMAAFLIIVGLATFGVVQNRAAGPTGLRGYDDDEWIKISAGTFYFGAADGDTLAFEIESPADPNFNIPYDYWISKYEVTNAQYKLFVDDTSHLRPACDWLGSEIRSGLENHPVACVSWYDAMAYVAWLNEELVDGSLTVVLPSEPEWEKAARGSKDDRIYPWGDDFDGMKLNCRATDCPRDGNSQIPTDPVGSFPEGASPYGVEDMAGNVCEWTRSKWGDPDSSFPFANPDFTYPYDPNDGRETLSGVDSRVVRGGSWFMNPEVVRVSSRDRALPDEDLYAVCGFRVVVRPPSQLTED